MKNLVLFFFLFILSCCKEEPITPMIDECPTCSSTIIANGHNWPSKPQYAFFEIGDEIDTMFHLVIHESEYTNDQFKDALVFVNIPFDVAEYRLDHNLLSDWGTAITLHVFEVEYGSATELYLPVLNGSSVINIETINKSTGEFSLSFNIFLFPGGDPNGQVHNSSYPNMIHFQGNVQGVITYR